MKKYIVLVLLGLSFIQVFAQQVDEADIFDGKGFYSFSDGGKYGIKFHGEIVLYPQYDHLSAKTYGLNNEGCIGAYKREGRVGLIVNGAPVTKVLFEEAKPICFMRDFNKQNISNAKINLFIVKNNGKWGISDIGGNILIQPVYDYISDKIYSNGIHRSRETSCDIFFLATKNEEDCVIDLAGRELLSDEKIGKIINSHSSSLFKTTSAIYNAASKAEAKLNKKNDHNIYSIIENLERLTLSYNTPNYQLDFVDGIEIKGKEGHIQICRQGAPVTLSIYDKSYPQEKGIIRVVKNNKYGLVDCIRGEIVPCEYDYISSFTENGYATIMDNGFEGKVYKSGYITLAYDLLQGDLKTAYTYAPDNLYLLRQVADKLYINERYKQAYELYDILLAKIKEQKIFSVHADRIQEDRDRAYNYSIGNYPQEKNEELSGWDIAFGFLNSVAKVTNTVGEIKAGGSAPSTTNSLSSGNGDISSKNVSKNTKNNKKLIGSNYISLDRTYSNWESRLIDMYNNPGKYSQQDFSDIPDIQNKMKTIRVKIVNMGGTRVQSRWETWKP